MLTLKRKIYDELLAWKKRSGGSTALMIDGARRVGKSFLCEQFAKAEYKSHILIDFGNAPEDILELFKSDSYNLDLFFAKLSAFYAKTLYTRESLIIFDEVQQFPRARQLIKYLVADARYDFIETGSLIRLKKNVQDIIIPSEEEHIEMFPLDFEEFLWAMGDAATAQVSEAFFRLTDYNPEDAEHVPSAELDVGGGRMLHVPKSLKGIGVFSFKRLCGEARGAPDYLAIARAYHTVILVGIPRMGPENRNEAARFVTLIDALYEHKVKLLVTADAEPEALYHAGDGRFEFDRTISRLQEMQSADYLAAGHGEE